MATAFTRSCTCARHVYRRASGFFAWLGWIGMIGGAGSAVIGVAMFLGLAPAGLAVPFAIVLSLFMVVLGVLLWNAADGSKKARDI